jgi:hypothetical protein
MKIFNLVLTEEDLQIVMAGLGELQGKYTFGLIKKLDEQVRAQAAAQMPATVAEYSIKESNYAVEAAEPVIGA